MKSVVESYVQHPEYKNSNYDFAILKLATPIAESETISYAKLQEEDVDPVAGEIATVAGWYAKQRKQSEHWLTSLAGALTVMAA